VSDPRKYLLLLGLILGGVAVVAYLAVPGSPGHKSAKQGLDLQGGLEVVLKAIPPKDQNVDPARMSIAQNIMRNRVDKLGVSEPEVRKQGTDQIVIQLAGVHDPRAAAALIGKTAQLEFYDLEADLTGPSVSVSGQPNPEPNIYSLLSGQQALVKDKGASEWYLFDKKAKQLIAGPAVSKDALFNTKPAKKRHITTVDTATGKTQKYAVFGVPKGTVVVSCGTDASICPGGTGAPTTTSWYLFKYDPENKGKAVPELTGADLKLSGTRADLDPSQGPVVLMDFTGAGSKKFQAITKGLYQRGGLQQAPQHFAIVLDRQIKSWPQIDYTDGSLANGISGNAQITGIGSFGEAKNLALVLQTGSLPYKFTTLESTNVSATLGKDSLQEAKRAAIGGLIAVIIFLLVVYRFMGIIAVLGLVIYAILMYGAILLLNVTLTLPGFAGLILTIGVAADANVVIFERIKEEVRAGKSVRAALNAGYAKGLHTILDANAVTCITAFILFTVATAGVKGFALMLLIGTVLSLVTAVFATRAMLGLLAGFRWFDNPRFMGATAQEIPRWQRIDVVGHRRLWFIISVVAVVLSVLAIAIQGLNLGIDFKGGTQVTFTTPKPTSLSDVRQQVSQDGAVVQGRGTQTGSDSFRNFQLRLKSLTAAEQSQLTTRLTNQVNARVASVKNVSSSFSRQILRSAIYAIVVSFALIALYVSLRYQWRFAVPIVRTLLNDVPIMLGIYAISGREVSASTVAAILTILGYSIYDTIIVFDRVRENMKLMPRSTIGRIANVSVWEVLRRSIFTSVITLLPIAALFIFGGSTLQDFAFAILVGISVGAVSTIFIATPLLVGLMERDPEYARRRDEEPLPGETEAEEDDVILVAAEEAAAAEPVPDLSPVAAVERAVAGAEAKRERRRQRRSSRPHGRAR
jgi:SecD/SecF fusion protein